MVDMAAATAHKDGVTPPSLPAGYEHGTSRAYRHCRPSCAACRAANAEQKAARRAARLSRGVPEEVHGRPFGYSYWNCRCPACSRAYLGEPKPRLPTRREDQAASTSAIAGVDTRVVRYSYEILPDPIAALRLRHLVGSARYIYNSAVRYGQAYRETHGQYPPLAGQSALLITEPRQRLPWLAAVPYSALSGALRDAQVAQSNHIASLAKRRKGPKVGAPRMKRKKHGGSAHFDGSRFRIKGGWRNTGATGGRLFLGEYVGWVGVRWSRALPSDPSSLTLVLKPTGRWYASFVVREPVRRTQANVPGRVAGIDLGITHFATIARSDGQLEKVDNPRFLLRLERKLAHMERDLARMVGPERGRKPSARWERQRRRIARLHAHIANQRENFARTLAARLIRENQALVVEALGVASLARTKVGKSVNDAAWGMFLKALAEGSANRGRDLILLPRYYPGSRICSACGVLDGAKPLSARWWTCPSCGVTLDRDINAAVNHLEYASMVASLPAGEQEALELAAGLAERINARGWGVGPDWALFGDTTPCETSIGRTGWERKLLARGRRSRRAALRRKQARKTSKPGAAQMKASMLAEDCGGIAAGSRRIRQIAASENPQESRAE